MESTKYKFFYDVKKPNKEKEAGKKLYNGQDQSPEAQAKRAAARKKKGIGQRNNKG